MRPPWWRLRPSWGGDVDARLVALARVAVGLAALLTLADYGLPRFDFFSDGGVLPRAALLDGLVRDNRFCLLDAVGPAWLVGVLWLGAVAAALAFVVGHRTRLANLALFVLVAGFQERDTLVFDGSDAVVRVLLFWCLFVPMGARGSVDAARSPAPPPARVPAFALRLAQLQVAWVYVVAVMHKLDGAPWRDGSAVQLIMGMEHQYARPLGLVLAHWPAVTRALTFGTIAVEAALPLLVFAPFGQPRLRRLALAAGVALHLGIALTMKPGCFSYVMILSYALLLDEAAAVAIWQALASRAAAALAPVLRRLPPRPLGPPRPWSRAAELALGAWCVAVLWFPVPRGWLPAEPGWLHRAVQAASLWQSWDMFAPIPVHDDLVLRGPGRLADGTRVDVLRGGPGPLPPERPTVGYSRWTKFVENYAYARDRRLLVAFGRYLCRRWNDDRGARPLLRTFDLERLERPVDPAGGAPPPWHVTHLWHHNCVD